MSECLSSIPDFAFDSGFLLINSLVNEQVINQLCVSVSHMGDLS